MCIIKDCVAHVVYAVLVFCHLPAVNHFPIFELMGANFDTRVVEVAHSVIRNFNVNGRCHLLCGFLVSVEDNSCFCYFHIQYN